MSQKRAKKGGEVGMNGEFYQGGEFLPNTELPSRHNPKVKGNGKAKKFEIEPYVWAYPPEEGKRSIFSRLSGTACKYNWKTKQLDVMANDTVLAYLKMSRSEVNELAARYNKGERWY